MLVAPGRPVRAGTPEGRWIVVGMVLGSAVTFVYASVVNVALPAIGDDLDATVSQQQWIVNAYLLPLAALILVTGSAGDRLGRRRVFLGGALVLSAASVLCALAPTIEVLVAGRGLQGIGAAAMTPASLAIIDGAFHPDDRSAAIAAWASGSALASAVAPFLGGMLVDSVGWRWVFALGFPLAAGSIWATARHVPDDRTTGSWRDLDLRGAAASAAAISGLVVALIEGPARGWGRPLPIAGAVMAVVGAWAFVAVERRNPAPLVPASIFRSRQFSGANGLTLFVYFGISGLFFFTAVGFQEILGWSAATAGAALLPSSVVMILLSPAAGRFSARHGPRLGVAGGAASIAVGTAMLATVGPGDTWARSVLPASIVIGLGMAAMVPTLTAAVLAAVPDDDVGVGAAVNNTVARSAGLLALASVPGLVGDDVAAGYDLALVICACAIAVGAVVGALTVGRCVATHTSQAPNPLGGCAQLSHPAQPVR